MENSHGDEHMYSVKTFASLTAGFTTYDHKFERKKDVILVLLHNTEAFARRLNGPKYILSDLRPYTLYLILVTIRKGE